MMIRGWKSSAITPNPQGKESVRDWVIKTREQRDSRSFQAGKHTDVPGGWCAQRGCGRSQSLPHPIPSPSCASLPFHWSWIVLYHKPKISKCSVLLSSMSCSKKLSHLEGWEWWESCVCSGPGRRPGRLALFLWLACNMGAILWHWALIARGFL